MVMFIFEKDTGCKVRGEPKFCSLPPMIQLHLCKNWAVPLAEVFMSQLVILRGFISENVRLQA